MRFEALRHGRFKHILGRGGIMRLGDEAVGAGLVGNQFGLGAGSVHTLSFTHPCKNVIDTKISGIAEFWN